MIMFLCTAGTIGLLACIIWLIIRIVKHKPKKPVIAGLIACLIILYAGGSQVPDANAEPEQHSDTDSSQNENADIITNEPEPFILDITALTSSDIGQDLDTGNLKLTCGDLLSIKYFDNRSIVIKAKIESSYSDEATINQNYFSVCDLIKNHGFDTCDELQYWAVADTTSGDETKVISFTLDKQTIQDVADNKIVENQLGNYVSDLYILPSLLGQNSESATAESISLDALATTFEALLSENYTGCTATADEAGITVNVWIDGVAMAVAATQVSGGGANSPDWVTAKNGTLAMAESLRETMNIAGHTDALLVVNVLNDQDTSKTLLSILNETIIYDVLA